MKVLVIAVVVVALFLACGGVISIMSPHKERPKEQATTAPTKPAAPAAEPVTVAERPAPAKPVIPGLFPVDVYGNLTTKGFTKRGPEAAGESTYWSLKREGRKDDVAGIPAVWSDVEIYGRNASNVHRINVSVTGLPRTSNEEVADLARQLFGYLATITFEGAKPDEARAWVAANIGENASASFGGVDYKLERNNTNAYALRMSVGD